MAFTGGRAKVTTVMPSRSEIFSALMHASTVKTP